MKSSKKIIFPAAVLFSLIVFAFISAPMAQAHPPASVELTYNMERQTLEVKIIHASPDPGKHYVKKVVIKKNGEVVGGGDYTSQPDKEIFAYAYVLAVVPGDLLEVAATCNIFGSKLAELKVQ